LWCIENTDSYKEKYGASFSATGNPKRKFRVFLFLPPPKVTFDSEEELKKANKNLFWFGFSFRNPHLEYRNNPFKVILLKLFFF